jgi:hypothetical protein
VTNAIFASLHRLAGRPFALRPRLFRYAKNALVTSEHLQIAAIAGGFRLRLGGGTLRSGCVPLDASLRPPLHFPRSPTTDRSRKKPHTRASCRISQSVIGQFQIFQSLIVKLRAIQLVAGTARRKPSQLYGVVGRVKDTTGRSLKRSRFRSSFDPPAAAGGVLPLGFHRGKSVCSKEDLTGMP